MTRFRPCIDIHEGKVKQIVGGTLRDDSEPEENFVSTHSPAHFAAMYREDALKGGHVIMLGPGNELAAREALAAYPGGLHIGGGIRVDNASQWLEAGASHVIVTSWIFDESGKFQAARLDELVEKVERERLVLDLSCRRVDGGWTVAMNRWQTLTDVQVTGATLDRLADSCAEFLIHAADVEGKCEGIDEELVAMLGKWNGIPITYAGGARSIEDLHRVQELAGGNVDLTIGSALDIFGGAGATYAECVAFNRSTG